eukprot:gb/GECG01010194.1/.p1 GENE.gb/GECG01010194.1/~~gb/GECG01010194.1/.p1  ORF type:complete len:166 (+),score=12.39 gb/GECG01010194.1/:1-498(+)
MNRFLGFIVFIIVLNTSFAAAHLPKNLAKQWRYNLTGECFSYDLRDPKGDVRYCVNYQNEFSTCLTWKGEGATFVDDGWYSIQLANKTDPSLSFCFYAKYGNPPLGNPADCGLNPHILDPLPMERMCLCIDEYDESETRKLSVTTTIGLLAEGMCESRRRGTQSP